MTLILAVNSHESIWLVADRRLTFENRPPSDEARKIMFLETPDAVAILGYAGLGVTALGTEPADWMSAVLRGRNLSLEQSLGVLAQAIGREFPAHLVRLPSGQGKAHHVIISAFLENEPRFYSIDLVRASNRNGYDFRYTRHVVHKTRSATPLTPRFVLAGSGGSYLLQDRNWARRVLRVVRANDRRQISDISVADQLAILNHEVHSAMRDKSVGPNCIVAWRHRKEGVHRGGGGHQFYTGTRRDSDLPPLPLIVDGADMRAFYSVMIPQMTEVLQAMLDDQPPKDLDDAAIDAEFELLPTKPDERLR